MEFMEKFLELALEFLVESSGEFFVEFFFSRPTQIDDMEYQLKSMPEKILKIGWGKNDQMRACALPAQQRMNELVTN